MKTNLILVLAGILFAGCASFNSGLVLNTAGPEPGQTASTNSGPGTLTVFSAYKVNADFNSIDPNRREYSDYRILDSDRKVVKWVHNVANNMLEGPVAIRLPAGKYFVVTRSNGYGIVTIPVIIAAHQDTILHLNGTDDDSAPNEANAVRLPDGEIVGWSAVNQTR
jgi:hypothetical protein